LPLIELTGVPGSGKTTFGVNRLKSDRRIFPGRRSLDSFGSNNNMRSYRCLILLSHITVFGCKHVITAVRFYRHIESSSISARWVLTIRFFFLLSQAGSLNRNKRIWLIDQGVLQFLLSCLARKGLSIEAARKLSKSYLESQLSSLEYIRLDLLDRDLLISRVRNSPKHLNQAKDDVENYIDRFVQAFVCLYS
jgi:hypothetical protein